VKYIVIAIALVGVLALARIDNSGNSIPHRVMTASDLRNLQLLDITKHYCDQAHNENEGHSERACAYLQDTYGVEYLCNSPDKGAYCWAETR
jgi:hypothetical protein